MQATVTDAASLRVRLERLHGDVWDEAEMHRAFVLRSVCAPFAGVMRRADGTPGTLQFTTDPRLYFAWIASAELSHRA